MIKKTPFLFVLALVCSCKNNGETRTAKISKESIQEEQSKILQLEFPDTVLLEENIQGKIRYELELNSLKPSDISSRYIFFHITTSNVRKGLPPAPARLHRVVSQALI